MPSRRPNDPHKCYVKGCNKTDLQFHHVTYKPAMGYTLCEEHHIEITVVNCNQSQKLGFKKLSNKHRWWAWSQWLKGELKPIYTPRAMMYLDSWGKKNQKVATVAVAAIGPEAYHP